MFIKMVLDNWKKYAIRWMERNRGLIVVLFCLPASFLFDIILNIRNKINRTLMSGGPASHDKRVRTIQSKVNDWNKLPPNKRPFMCTAKPNWLSLSITFFRKDLCHQIPIPLYNILSIDEDNLSVRVEPMVTVGDITAYLIPKGYTLAVTLEIADATLGGLAMGVGMTTHSHQPYVRLSYIPIKGQKDYCDMIRMVSGALEKDQKTPDYVEATIFSKDEAVIMTGHYDDVKSNDDLYKVNNITKWYKPWFYKHVESFLKKGKHQELIPLREYLLRHNRAIFWVVESMIPFGNNPLFRLLFGWLLPPKPAFLKFTTTPGIRAMTFTKQVFQDIVLPMTELEKQIDISEKLFDTYPVLVYPCRVYDHGPHSGQLRPPRPEQLTPGANWAMFNDLGVYGVPGPVKRKEPYDAVAAMRAMEKFTRDVGGYSFLYADIFMDRKEFEEMFDMTLYEKVREKYFANHAFPHLYDKVKPEIDVFEVGKQYINPL
ncbi:hypothetical protein B566_EDAN012820 [Ephemera danica]|nr:hypothetical protein B566_EDAN012820 [Ephemera danica]